jgi:hypothetical protein
MIDHCFVTDIDLVTLDERGHGHDHREVFHVALEVVCHREHGAFTVAYQHDL